MRNELDGRFLLDVYSSIEKHGMTLETEQGKAYQLNGVTVTPGHDGYDIEFDNGKVQVTLGFHHKWHSTAKTEFDMDEFIDTLKKIRHDYA